MAKSEGTYHLGLDLGTTWVAAGILRDGRSEIVTLGDRSPVVPSVLFFREDGEVLTGDSAARRGLREPTRVVREFKRRVGDTTPIVVGQTPYSTDVLLARLLRSVVEDVASRQGGPPMSIALTHPANWGSYKIDVLHQAVRMADLGSAAADVQTLTEPVAAAIHFAATERLEPGGTVAVYDLGGGTFDAAVLRKAAASGSPDFEVLGDVEGIERLGGIDFDEAVFQHVVRWCETALAELNADDPPTMQALARLRQECVSAKEALSTDSDVSIPVVLPNLQTEVRLTRAEFEAMIRPLIQQTVEALRRAIRGASVRPDDLAAVLLVGGSSRIPLIAEMVGAELGRPIALDRHPKHTVALGAAIAAGRRAGVDTPVVADESPGVLERAVRATAPAPNLGVSASSIPASFPASVDVASAQSPPTRLLVAPPVTASPLADSRSADDTGVWIDDSAPTNRNGDPSAARTVPFEQAFQAARREELSSSSGGGHGDHPLRFQPSEPPAGRGRPMLIGALAVLALMVIGVVAFSQLRGGGAGDDTEANNADGAETAAADTDTDAETAAADAGEELSSTSEVTVATSTTEAPSSTATSTTAAETTTTSESTTTVDNSTLRATITGIGVDGDRYSVSYTTNFEPLISSDPSRFHLHFFFDTVSIEQAGVPGGGPWILYDTPSPFTGYGPADRPAGATSMCVTVATHDHRVEDPSVIHCMELPVA